MLKRFDLIGERALRLFWQLFDMLKRPRQSLDDQRITPLVMQRILQKRARKPLHLCGG
jgi:hypothetical protein